MDILEELEHKNNELTKCYAIIQLQQEKVSELAEKVKHLEELLMHKAYILKKD